MSHGAAFYLGGGGYRCYMDVMDVRDVANVINVIATTDISSSDNRFQYLTLMKHVFRSKTICNHHFSTYHVHLS